MRRSSCTYVPVLNLCFKLFTFQKCLHVSHPQGCEHPRSRTTGLEVPLYSRTLEVRISNFCRDVSYPDWGFSWSFSVPPSKLQNSSSNRPRLLLSTSFTYYERMRRLKTNFTCSRLGTNLELVVETPTEKCERNYRIYSINKLLLLGFWTLFIVRNSINKKTQRFGNWICFCPQLRGGGHLLY
jgi:hypothetical protein